MKIFEELIKIQSKKYFDFFILVHILSGIITYVILKRYNIGLLIGYLYYDKLIEYKKYLYFLLIFFIVGKIYLIIEFSNLKIKNFEDLKRFVTNIE